MNQSALARQDVRRIRRVGVTPELLVEMLKIPPDGLRLGDYCLRCERDAIPMSAKALRATINDRGDIELVIEDLSFDPIEPAHPIPQMCPMYSRVDITRDLKGVTK